MPWDPPQRFGECILELRARLETDDDALADELLADAESLGAEVEARVQSVQQRATTLQGAVAIAAAVTLTGAALVIDPARVPDATWRGVFAAGLAALVALLTLSAFRALGASSRAFSFMLPSDEDIFERAALPAARAKARRAAYLLQAFGRNNEVAALKVGYLNAATRWLRLALVVLVALAALVACYVLFGQPTPTRPAARQATDPRPSSSATFGPRDCAARARAACQWNLGVRRVGRLPLSLAD